MGQAPTRSAALCYVRSPALVRARSIHPITWSIVKAHVQLLGFGSFSTAGGNQVSGNMFNFSFANTYAVFNPDWPAVYTKCTEVWIDPTGTQTITSLYSIYADKAQPVVTTTTTGTFYGTGTITSCVVTSTTITITYGTGSTYVATLSGTILQPSSAGPFNVSDATYGWQALVSIGVNILAANPTPNPDPQFCFLYFYRPKSISPGYELITTFEYSSQFPTPLPPHTGTWFLYDSVEAACYGMPMCPSSGSIIFNFDTISDVPASTSVAYGNSGECVVAKSKWYISATTWQDQSSGINTGFNSSHSTVYYQTVPFPALTGGSAIINPNYPNPTPNGAVMTFDYTDVIAAIGAGNYGMLGFASPIH